jgi:hypothetical protein
MPNMRECHAPLPSSDARAALRVRLRSRFGEYDLIATRLSFCIDRRLPVHPYAQSPDLANDDLGYGEEVRVPVAANRGGVLRPGTVLEIRTKTGTTTAPEPEPPPEPL